MPDEVLEKLWTLKGGPGLVALHALFPGRYLPGDQVRQVLDLTREQLGEACAVAGGLGLVELDEERIAFVAFSKSSAQRGRLDYALEPHREEAENLQRALRGRLLVRFLSTAPGGA